ncbi:adenylyl cyclase-associated protein 1 isoform X2 [Pogonomyrmex barbatus]|uniref:Adenylyl cyclase-associated protein 1 isoform X2 n=1 Tax=Pogonomyrmex barbatus TaxID=144034 RepID=A0A6I9VMR1_9HYME|nr:adenylyl cyclase-associated protein 1 isoform X2 [Pogonomyrmex barbatus]
MFKCCVCNSASKKANAETRSKADDTPIGSPRLTALPIKVDDEIKSPTKKTEKLNGNVQIAEKTPPPVLDSIPICDDSAMMNSRESPQNADVEEKSSLVSMREATVETAEEIAEETAKETAEEIPVERTAEETAVEETVEEPAEEVTAEENNLIIVDEDNSKVDNSVAADQMEDIESVSVASVVSVVKMNLYDASGYIERTIDDGPEDEGDDSVFEGCPSDNEIAKKVPPVSSIPRWLSEEDDGEYVSGGCSGMQEPPATPVARDELALRRHRFFSDLLQAAQNSTEHRVRFDPLGPMVHTGCEAVDKEEHLEELVNRLENVTKRLENVHFAVPTQDIAVQTSTPSPKRSTSVGSTSSSTSNLHSKQETVSELSTTMSIPGYEGLLTGPVKEYLELSQKIGGDVAAHSKLVEKAFQIQLQYVQMAASRAAPTNQSEQVSLLAPMSAQIQQIQDFREKNRGSPFFNHLSAISESIPALGWVAVSPTPAPYVKEMNDAGQFYTNRVLKDWKEKDKIHIDWCKAWVQTLTDLQQYVRQHHTTGLVWGKSAAPMGIPPPPPPSMPIGDIGPMTVNDDRSALFAQINQGEDITKSLKKVTSDMQTHKNPALRSGPAPFKAPTVNAAPMKSVLPANAPIDKPPVFTKDGKKWLVEYHKGENLVIDNVEMNNVIYMFRCQDSTLTIKGKVNSIVMDSCRKSSVVFDSVVSSIEFVNCQSVQMQIVSVNFWHGLHLAFVEYVAFAASCIEGRVIFED